MSNNPTIPRRLAEVPGITISPAPDGAGLAVGAVHDGRRVLYIVPNPEDAPTPALRDVIEARNVASVTRQCPACGEGDDDDLQAPIQHAQDCAAADENLNAALAAALKIPAAKLRGRRDQSERRFHRAGLPVATMTTAHGRRNGAG